MKTIPLDLINNLQEEDQKKISKQALPQIKNEIQILKIGHRSKVY